MITAGSFKEAMIAGMNEESAEKSGVTIIDHSKSE